MRLLGYLLLIAAFPVAGFIVSHGNNLVKQPVIAQPQTWLAIIAFAGLVSIGWSIISKRTGGRWL